MRHLILIILVLATALHAADLPLETQMALNSYQVSVQAAAAKARVALQAQVVAATKKGDLDMAVAIKAEIAKLPVAAATGVAATYSVSVPGVWNGSWVLKPDGGTSSGGLQGRYVVEGHKVTINWANGSVEWFSLDDDGMGGSGKNKDGIALIVRKQAP